MALKTTKAIAAAAFDVLLDNINEEGGSNAAGYVRFYTGSAPADLATAETGTLLAQCALVDGSQPAFGATNTTTLVATGYTSGGKFAEDASANASGAAGYWRLYTHGGTARLQGTVGTSGADINLNSLTITSGLPVIITALNPTATGYF